MEIFFTKDKKWIDKWDNWIDSNQRGSHLLFSDWLKSYKNYGFDFELVIALKDGLIIGGFGAVIAKMSFFKFYIVPHGPIALDNNILVLDKLIAAVSQGAKKNKACYAQINLPLSSNDLITSHSMVLNNDLDSLKLFKKGHFFKYVFSLNGLNWIDLRGFQDEDLLLSSFKTSVRRDIRSSCRKGLDLAYLKDIELIKQAYKICEENARKNNYAIRSWSDFGETIINLIQKNRANFIAAYKDGALKGAILLVKSGGYYTYILGGTVKEKPDLLVGHFLQWEALKLSLKENCNGYNISLGGSKGVQEFKNSFNTENIFFENSKYNQIINPYLFAVFSLFEKYLKPYKSQIAKFIAVFKNKKQS